MWGKTFPSENYNGNWTAGEELFRLTGDGDAFFQMYVFDL